MEKTVVKVESLPEDESFKLRLEIYLRINALRVQKLSENKEKFNSYIKERERIIEEMIGDSMVSENGKIIYP
ncbi:hypothetical protein ACNF42_07060 [Cuniculiplasma sp. SKW3]|uniref:hypothetical protein n=1 Tax=unclassified Cuniculiplasma TaxID=2619706 RepID=UPI003FD529C5